MPQLLSTLNKPFNPIASSKILFLRKKLYLNIKYSNVLTIANCKDPGLVFRIWYLVDSSEETLNWQKVCVHNLLVE